MITTSNLNAGHINLFFGYIDQQPYTHVIDSAEAQWIISNLTKDCSKSEKLLCGFDLVEDNLLSKNKSTIRVFQSSYTHHDPSNRNHLLTQQLQKSEQIRNDFFKSLFLNEYTIYVGHSRYGYGPDFYFAKLTSQETLDKDYYKSISPHDNQFNEALKTAQSGKSKKIAFISCDSSTHINRNELNINSTLKFKLLLSKQPLTPIMARKALLEAIGYFLTNNSSSLNSLKIY